MSGVKQARSVLVGPVAAARNDLPLAELVGRRDGIAAIFAPDAEEVARLKAPKLIGGADLRGGLAVVQIRHGHFGGLGVDFLRSNANHGGEEDRETVMVKLADSTTSVTGRI